MEDECPPTVDLNDREKLAVPTLEVGIAADVGLFELEIQLGAKRGDRGPRPIAQMTTLGAVENDAAAGPTDTDPESWLPPRLAQPPARKRPFA
jgi:hypothetical protein